MKITYYVNTMFLLEGKNSRVLCDPWITNDNKSRSGLYNYPKLETKTALWYGVKSISLKYVKILNSHRNIICEFDLLT